jgi:hypothetical protein
LVNVRTELLIRPITAIHEDLESGICHAIRWKPTRQNRLIRHWNPTPPFRGKKRKRVAGKIHTSAIPPSDTLGTALDCGRIVAVRRKFIYFCLRERKEVRVIVPFEKKRRRREPYESCSESRTEKHREREISVNKPNQRPAWLAGRLMLGFERSRPLINSSSVRVVRR